MRAYAKGVLTGGIIGGLAALAVIDRLPAQGEGQAPIGQAAALGVLDLGTEKEELDWKSAKGNRREATVVRKVFKVPESYGKLVAIDRGEFWFLDAQGNLRNVRLEVSELSKVLPVPMAAGFSR